MVPFFGLTLLALFVALLQPVLAIRRPNPRLHFNRDPHSLADPTTTRRSNAQIEAFLLAHNIVRRRHNAKLLTWSVPLAEKAEQWADACQFKHTNGVLSDTPYGENIVAATGNFPISAAVATFVQDADQYNPVDPKFSHFTQVVWQSTTELGCAVAHCDGIFGRKEGPATLYVCLYNPPGNVIGELAENVHV